MNKPTIVIFSGLCLLLGALFPCRAEDPLRLELEKVWEAHLQASRSGEESQLQQTMSAFRLGQMKNDLANAGRALTPGMIRGIAEQGPDISTATFVTLLEKGDTAGLVYVQDSEETDATGQPRISFSFIKFVKEETGWKVDAGMNIGGPKFQEDGSPAKFDPEDLPPTYEIDGEVRPAPAPVTAPYASGVLDVLCPGYKTEVTVNGIAQETTVDSSFSGLLDGGLRQGENTIVITITPTADEATFDPRVAVHRILKNREMREVFRFEPKADIAGTHTLTFQVEEE